MTRHGQRGDLSRKINAQVSAAQYGQLEKAAACQRVNISTILRWMIEDYASEYTTDRPMVRVEAAPKEA